VRAPDCDCTSRDPVPCCRLCLPRYNALTGGKPHQKHALSADDEVEQAAEEEDSDGDDLALGALAKMPTDAALVKQVGTLSSLLRIWGRSFCKRAGLALKSVQHHCLQKMILPLSLACNVLMFHVRNAGAERPRVS
jgi:hypothetical protein